MKELMGGRLEGLEIGVVMIDGVHFADQTMVIELGIDIKKFKHILGLWQGATGNTTVVKALLKEIVRRGLNTNQRILVVLDGSKALRKAVGTVLGKDTPVQRWVVHKKRNIPEQLPKHYQSQISKRLTKAYNRAKYVDAKDELVSLVCELELINPSAARSLEERMKETLTLRRLRIPGVLRKTLQSTNLIESPISFVRHITWNVKRWNGGNQIEGWAAAGLLETEKRFTRIKGFVLRAVLADALDNTEHSRQQAA